MENIFLEDLFKQKLEQGIDTNELIVKLVNKDILSVKTLINYAIETGNRDYLHFLICNFNGIPIEQLVSAYIDTLGTTLDDTTQITRVLDAILLKLKTDNTQTLRNLFAKLFLEFISYDLFLPHPYANISISLAYYNHRDSVQIFDLIYNVDINILNDREKYGLMVFLSSRDNHEYKEKLMEYKDEFVKVINKDYKEESDNTIRKIEDPFLNAVYSLYNSIEVSRLLNEKNEQFKQELKGLMASYMDELNKELNKDYENANNLVNKNTIIENYMIKLIHLCDEYRLNSNNYNSYNETFNEYKYVLKNMC